MRRHRENLLMGKANRIPDRSEVTDETMMPLSVAAEIAMAHGIVSSVSAKSLRREAGRDRLVTYELFGRIHTTLGDIKRMARKCLVQPRERASTTRTRTTGGSSATPDSQTLALAALMESTRKLSRSSKST